MCLAGLRPDQVGAYLQRSRDPVAGLREGTREMKVERKGGRGGVWKGREVHGSALPLVRYLFCFIQPSPHEVQ